YQHAPYEFQLARKAEILREQLARVGKIDYSGEIEIVSGPPFGYRNRVQVHIAERGRRLALGYLAPRSHELVPLEGDCPISSPRVNQVLALLRERLHDPRFPRFIQSLELFTNENELQINVLEKSQPVAKSFAEWFECSQEIDYPTAIGAFRVQPRSFFQVNRFLIEKLVEAALREVRGETALDLYAGVGLFAIPMAGRFASVTAVESGLSAARDLDFNAARAGAELAVEHARVEDFLSKLEQAPEFILADPPRAGLDKNVVAQLKRLGPARLTIVSCDPATLARDLAGLVDNAPASYAIEHLTMIDLFPQTYHLETIAHLQRV
ncbi:MAG TPA: class I SAM-dependent RNA methyltransferase, partial [Bryobacteraceae bacterium]|nr:class I SAM-dependent RNA methyltransferase [Bryobacteraceae bacterium]